MNRRDLLTKAAKIGPIAAILGYFGGNISCGQEKVSSCVGGTTLKFGSRARIQTIQFNDGQIPEFPLNFYAPNYQMTEEQKYMQTPKVIYNGEAQECMDGDYLLVPTFECSASDVTKFIDTLILSFSPKDYLYWNRGKKGIIVCEMVDTGKYGLAFL